MKKKVLASLLAVCMMAGLAVPAFAYTGEGYTSSSVAGLDDEITELKFAKDSYTIAEDGSENLAAELTAYCGDKKIIQEPVLEWSISDSLAFGIGDDGVVTNIGEKTGSATVTVKSENGKTASTKVVATKKNGKATSWKFTETKYATTENATNIEVKIAPSSDSTSFTDNQVKDLIAAAKGAGAFEITAVEKGATATDVTAIDAKLDDGKIVVTLANPTAATVKDYTVKFNYGLLKDNDTTDSYAKINRNTRISFAKTKEAKKVIRKSNVQIEVGQIVDLNDFVAYTSGANYRDGVTWSIEPYNDDAETSDYAVQNSDGNKILGVMTGKVKAVATMKDQAAVNKDSNDGSTSLIVEIVARGTLAKPDTAAKYTITPATASPKVGDKVALTLNDADGKAVENVTWSVSNGALATVTTAANPTTLNAKAAGKVVVYARVADKVVATAEITVVGEGTTTTPSVPGTSNPSTGDSFFSNLF